MQVWQTSQIFVPQGAYTFASNKQTGALRSLIQRMNWPNG